MNNIKSWTKGKTLTLILLVVMVSLCAVSSFMLINNKVSAEEISPFVIDLGTSGTGTYSDPYYENPWSGRITSTENLGGNDYVNINIDTRGGLNDNIIIEFQSYYLDIPNNKHNNKLTIFMADIEYYTGTSYSNLTFNSEDHVLKTDEAVGGFTKQSKSTKLSMVSVKVTIKNDNKTFYVYYQLSDYGVKPMSEIF